MVKCTQSKQRKAEKKRKKREKKLIEECTKQTPAFGRIVFIQSTRLENPLEMSKEGQTTLVRLVKRPAKWTLSFFGGNWTTDINHNKQWTHRMKIRDVHNSRKRRWI